MDDRVRPADAAEMGAVLPHARDNEIVERTIDSTLLVYDLKQQRVHILNETAALIWRLCDGNRPADDIAALIASHFPERLDIARADVAEIVESFANEQLLHA